MRLSTPPNGRRLRRGVTLIEMLVVVALVVLMMTILASIFQVATGAISVSRTIQELDNSLKYLDMTIRQDLAGVTAKMTPPNDPSQKRGYFEYGENAPADLQGEDTDDYLAMTVKAPEGQTFTGRVWVQPRTSGITNTAIQPVTVTSQFAEVIYFLRNGNLYRRVLLIVPERNGSIVRQSANNTAGVFTPTMFNGQTVSWLAVNDISARPAVSPITANSFLNNIPLANDLGDLTNRENRFARQRFNNDYWNVVTSTFGQRDGIIDDVNLDGIPDYWPTLTASQVAIAAQSAAGVPQGHMNEDRASMPQRMSNAADLYCFPFIFPGMYSLPERASLATGGSSLGWLHALDYRTVAGVPGQGAIFNHAPIEFGDSLPIPDPNVTGRPGFQTWWGFPTWRETASPFWRDPVDSLGSGSSLVVVNVAAGFQRPGLRPFDQSLTPLANNAPTNLLPSLDFLPGANGAPYGSDLVGYNISPAYNNGNGTAFTGPLHAWEDDLIMTGVRSFDVKAYDPNAGVYNSANIIPNNTSGPYYNAGYYDLGYASTDYVKYGNSTGIANLYTGTTSTIWDGDGNPQGFGHEGRMPPVFNDNRVDPQRPLRKTGNVNQPYTPNNIGDNTVGTTAPQRIRRVWDSWSTDYTNAPAVDINLRGSTFMPAPLDLPIYPSYPPPYPQPLRGIQIQIRVVDPKNERVKVLTIRQDFSDKL